MKYFLSIIGLIGSFFMIYKREIVGDMFGEPEWAHYVGGIYNVVIIVGIFIFFWSLATITNTTELLFYPFISLFTLGKGPVAPPSGGF